MLIRHNFRVTAKKEGFREIMLCKWQKRKRKHWGLMAPWEGRMVKGNKI